MTKTQSKIHGSTQRRRAVGKKRAGPSKASRGKPGGDLAAYLHHEMERRGWSVSGFYKELQRHGFTKKSPDTVSKWVQGESTPRLNDLSVIASTLGLKDWFSLVAAVKRHTR